jgi:UDP-N-acetylglucosamine 4-epimerase
MKKNRLKPFTSRKAPKFLMTTRYQTSLKDLHAAPKTWLITGVAGFIGSHLLETLLKNHQRVRGLDNFSTGHKRNLDDVRAEVGPAAWKNFSLMEGDITQPSDCQAACQKVDYVLHQAALASVPGSIEDPVGYHRVNVDGFLNMLLAARDAGVKRVVYASSSAIYGDNPALPKVETQPSESLSPYAATKFINEIYALQFARTYGLSAIGLRYFNVFGQRQDPLGAYAAVIPKWVASLLVNEAPVINGDGETTRDFCYVKNVVQANLLAATTSDVEAINRVYNVASGEFSTLKQLYALLRDELAPSRPALSGLEPRYAPFRPGDIRHSHASTDLLTQLLGYRPTHSLKQGIEALAWYSRAVV